MRRKKLLICVGVCMVLACIVGVSVQLQTPPKQIKDMLESNKRAYDYVANFYYNDFAENETNCAAYSFLENDRIICYESMFILREINLEKSEIDIFKSVKNSYYVDEKILDRVYVYNNYVSLCNENGRKCIVYSVNGTAPKYLNNPNDKIDKINAIRIAGNWYYVVGY